MLDAEVPTAIIPAIHAKTASHLRSHPFLVSSTFYTIVYITDF